MMSTTTDNGASPINDCGEGDPFLESDCMEKGSAALPPHCRRGGMQSVRTRCAGCCSVKTLFVILVVAMAMHAFAVCVGVAVFTTGAIEAMQAADSIIPAVRDLVSKLDAILSHVKF